MYDFERMKELSISIVKNVLEDIDIINSNDELEVSCTWFNMSLKENSRGITFVSEDYNLSLKFLLWFEVYYSNNGFSEEVMMRVIGNILKQFSGDCILLSNGDKPILERRNNTLVVDDSKLDSIERFPFNALEISYIEGKLEQV